MQIACMLEGLLDIIHRNFDGVVGWFYFPVNDDNYSPLPAPSANTGRDCYQRRTGTFTVEASALNVRAAAGLDAEIVAVYTTGQRD